MSSRWAGALLVSLCGVGTLAAQDPADVLQRMEARLDSLREVVRRRDSADLSANISDTVVAGGLRIATSPGYRAVAQAAAEQAWAQLLTRFGRSGLERAQLPVLEFGVAFSPAPATIDTAAIARGILRSASQTIWRQQDGVSTTWLRGYPPIEEFSASDRRIVAEELVRTPARPNRACFEGDPAACASALGIRLGPDTLADWYPPEAWPRLAGLVGGALTGPELAARQECERSGDETACRMILTPSRVTPPVSIAGRRMLVQMALDAGGAGAAERLLATGEHTLEERLSSSAGVPMDTLLSRWSAAMRTAPTRGPARPARELLLALAWSGLLLAGALGGSRWR